MNGRSAMRQTTALGETLRQRPLSRRAATVESMAALVLRVRGEFVEMPGLRLTAPQARLFGVAPDAAHDGGRAIMKQRLLTWTR